MLSKSLVIGRSKAATDKKMAKLGCIVSQKILAGLAFLKFGVEPTEENKLWQSKDVLLYYNLFK